MHGVDEVAYLRFASVYQAFTSAEDFEKERSDRASEDLELDDVCAYSSHDRRVRPLERKRAGIDVDDSESLDDTYGIELG